MLNAFNNYFLHFRIHVYLTSCKIVFWIIEHPLLNYILFSILQLTMNLLFFVSRLRNHKKFSFSYINYSESNRTLM